MFLRRLLLPEPPRHLPHARAWNVASRTVHLAAIAVLVGGHVFGVEAERLVTWLWIAIGSGAALMLIEMYPSIDWLAQLAGVFVLAKLALLCVVPFAWEWRVPILFGVLVIASVSSHMRGRYRHYSLLYRRNMKAKALLLLVLLHPLGAAPAAAQDASPSILRWGGDAEGGAPFVEADPSDPSVLRGFDVEVAALIAQGLGRTPRFVQVAWTSIDASAARGDFDIGMSGVEDSPARRARLAVTRPYFEFREVLTVRAADAARFVSLASLAGRRVGTLAGTQAYEMLLAAGEAHGITPVSYDDDVHPYTDLADGRLDAVLLDHIIAARASARTPGLVIQSKAIARGYYVGVLAPGNAALRDRIDAVLNQAMRDGRLEQIYRRWGIWDDEQAAFVKAQTGGAGVPVSSEAANPRRAEGAPVEQAVSSTGRMNVWAATLRYLPAVLRASLVTIVLSCLSMALAVLAGITVASGRLYGGVLLRSALTTYVEVTRGTPVLLQLFVIYYGLSSLVRLPAFAAAWLGLGLNYAAYESEIYRGALLAVPSGQLEAARTLGLSEPQVLRLVRAPQALRLALAPMTNDFVALLKDSSLVSVITVIELTKETSIFASNIGSWVLPGALCAIIYLAMSLPLSQLARRLERKWKVSLQ